MTKVTKNKIKNRKVKIMVGSTVYGFEDQLSQIVAQLNMLDYEVLNSHHGSIKVNPHFAKKTNLKLLYGNKQKAPQALSFLMSLIIEKIAPSMMP